MSERIKTARGVYLDLSKSPYIYTSMYGDVFRFSSAKRLEIYDRDVTKELDRVEKLLDRHDMRDFIPAEIHALLRRSMYEAFYKKIER